MSKEFNPVRYSTITGKNNREIVMLRGSGCTWRRCKFCDYHLDFSKDTESNFKLNSEALSNVTGKYGKLEVINSGSFVDLDEKTMKLIEKTCLDKNIKELHFESHYKHRDQIKNIRDRFKKLGITLKLRAGVETFDYDFRENVLDKGIYEHDPKVIASYFDEICLLFGITGQTSESMKNDIETGLKYFDRVFVNIMNENTTNVKPDKDVINTFIQKLYPIYKDNESIDILLNNTDFGVGKDRD